MSAYGATVLEHFRRPRNQRRLDAPTVAHEGYNPLCGDRVRVELAVDRDVIAAAAFTANACAICTASASLLTERLTGLSVGDALGIAEDEMVAALESDVPPARRACATLPLTAMRQALANLGSG
ncbi:MAG: iron-sulfur cluster assembly scaffold protein [Gemmatimonadaceae bacterium]